MSTSRPTTLESSSVESASDSDHSAHDGRGTHGRRASVKTEELFDPKLAQLCEHLEQVSLHTAKTFSVSSRPRNASAGTTDQADETATESETETDTSESSNEAQIFMDLPNYPVLLVYLENFAGVMDDLVERQPEDAQAAAEWEKRWAAWIFQVIAALCVVQHLAALTHNDLHTNNVAWRPTEEPFLYYRRRNGTVWKVPTYGKIFTIIDYGRVIFRVRDKLFYSDDFCKGNYASTQYNFGPIRNIHVTEEVLPNPSFDLCRFATSFFVKLFPEQPPNLPNGTILSAESGLVVRETVSELFNLLWSWLITDDGENVLVDADGDDKYPCFDLYENIARSCHRARPCDQVGKKLFCEFQLSAGCAPPQGSVVYSLFF